MDKEMKTKIKMERILNSLLACLAVMFSLSGCVEVPAPGSIAADIGYKNTKQYALSGMSESIGTFEGSSSTLPLTFEIAGVREASGQDVSALQELISVIQYKEPIDGNESEEELKMKTDTVQLPALSINKYTGVIETQEGNKIPAGEYHFDIKVANSSGSSLLKDALIVVFQGHQVVSYSSGMAKAPEIERVADSPNQILFVGYLNGIALPGDRIDFTVNRTKGFKGTFVNDTENGEIWNVKFPVNSSDTYCTWKTVATVDGVEKVSYKSENFNFVLGLSGSYIIRLYK
jgi:Domain of unknown function (DUF5007)